MTDHSGGQFLAQGLVLLAAAVIAAPLFKRIGLGIVLGYLAAGIIIGPWGLSLFARPEGILGVAEFGVVLLLFIIGLELNPTRLWTMRRDIFVLGAAQVLICGVVLSAAASWFGLGWRAALIAGFALALSSTAFALQLLQERGQLRSAYGQKTFAILLFQDLSIVPLLALLPLIASDSVAQSAGDSGLVQAAKVGGALALVILGGRFLLNPLFGLLAKVDAREVLIAAALLVVIGAALAMHSAGVSMALGAFLAGVMLAESSYRHQLEADIEPFRALLLGLFFIGVGMSVDLRLVAANWPVLLAGVGIVLSIKASLIWALARLFGIGNADALRMAATIPQGGEFGFVLFSAAVAAGIMAAPDATLLSAIVIVSMATTPLICAAFERAAGALAARGVSKEVVATFEIANPRIIVVGFGRFGQIVGQMFMAHGLEIVAIDRDPDRIAAARKLGYAVYYGDATRPDLLRAAGAGEALIIALCINKRDAMSRAIDAIRAEFPGVAIFCRAADRFHALELQAKGVDFAIRETFESGIAFARAALDHVGLAPERIDAVEEDVRQRDAERMRQQATGGELAGLDILHRRTPPGRDDGA